MEVDQEEGISASEIQQQYANFLDDRNRSNINHEKITQMIIEKKCRLIVNLNDLRAFEDGVRCKALLTNGYEEIPIFQKALKEVVLQTDLSYGQANDEFFIGFEGSFGSKHLTPRTLSSFHLGNLVCVEGIVTKCSLIYPKVVRSVHYCPATKKTIERKYNDLSSFDAEPSVNIYPTKDEAGNDLETEYGLSKYRDHQGVTIQEMPEKAPTGQLPRSLDVTFDNDLVDSCKPGDRVLIVGVYRCLPGKKAGFTSGVFKSVLLANYVKSMKRETEVLLSANDITACRAFSKRDDPFSILAKSLAPSIHGHEYIKKAVLCLLLGGTEKILDNKSRLRGDINILLIGDPSVAKSQMLRYVANVAPTVVLTTGRGSSGVGLTAAVATDHETGERRLDAGAMVIADRGIVCIDEFDKMSDADRTSIHEVMEQGRVTIAKAGIHARLNARTSVLAAANPVFGRYDEYKSPMDNINLQDSLLSRFDLIFIVLDKAEEETDTLISEHVIRVHRYRDPDQHDGEPTPMMQDEIILGTDYLNSETRQAVDKNAPTEIYDRTNSNFRRNSHLRERDQILSIEFMRKYISIAKHMKPKITKSASKLIVEEYTSLRSADLSENTARTQPLTARSLETMIRLATAHAKARLSPRIEKKDAEVAISLIKFALYQKVEEKEKRKRGREGPRENFMDVEEGENIEPTPSSNPEDEEGGRSAKKARLEEESSGGEESEAEEEEEEDMETDTLRNIEIETQITEQRFEEFKEKLTEFFVLEGPAGQDKSSIKEWVGVSEQGNFTSAEVEAALLKLSNSERIFISGDMVFMMN